VAERPAKPATALLAVAVAAALLFSGCGLIDPGADSTPSEMTRDNKPTTRKGG
jgi:hypothetical protein